MKCYLFGDLRDTQPPSFRCNISLAQVRRIQGDPSLWSFERMTRSGAQPRESAKAPGRDLERPALRRVVVRHDLATRLTHWINALAMSLLLVSGLQIFNAHPALYRGDTGYDTSQGVVEIGADTLRRASGHVHALRAAAAALQVSDHPDRLCRRLERCCPVDRCSAAASPPGIRPEATEPLHRLSLRRHLGRRSCEGRR